MNSKFVNAARKPVNGEGENKRNIVQTVKIHLNTSLRKSFFIAMVK